VSGSGISWDVCKSATCSRQITTPAPHHSVFYRPDALPAAQPTVSKHWRQMAKHRITRRKPHDSSGTRFFIPKISAKFDRGHPLRGRQMQVGWVKIGDFREIAGYISVGHISISFMMPNYAPIGVVRVTWHIWEFYTPWSIQAILHPLKLKLEPSNFVY